MNDQTDAHDQADQEILASTVTDEALEAAAGTDKAGHTIDDYSTNFWVGVCCSGGG